MARSQKPTQKPTSKPLDGFARIRRFFWRLIWRTALLGLVAAGLFLTLMWNITPDVRDISPQARGYDVRIWAGDGQTLIGTFGTTTADPVTADTIPQNLARALIASEDRRFYWHPGLDPEGLARAIYTNLQTGRMVQGGSTLTQQFAKLRYLSSERSLRRKLYEAVLALKLEWHHNKNEILAAYMNEVYVGDGVYGFSGAAKRYFNKTLAQLTDYEAAVLAGIIQAPSYQNPGNSETRAKARARLVIGAMEDVGYLSAKEATAYRNQEVQLLPPQTLTTNHPEVLYFTKWIEAEIEDNLNEILTTYGDILNQHIDVYTTIDLNLQREASQVARNMILSEGASANATQVGAVVMDKNGAVLAMVGGADFRASQVNRVTQTYRQPGSTFKLFPYMAALAAGQTPLNSIQDVPRAYEGWTPRNYSGRSHGEVPLIQAFSKSYNIAAVNLTESLGRNRIRRLAAELMNMNVGDIPEGPSVTLGSGEVRLLDLTAAYGIVATGGQRLRPYGIKQIVAENGDGLDLETFPVRSSLSRQSSALGHMSFMMRETVKSGTGRRARIDGYTFGKTGTTSSFRDAWFVGFQNSLDSGALIAGVWMGNDDNSAMDGVTGGGLPAKLWKQIVSIGSPLSARLTAELPTGTGEIEVPGLDENPDSGFVDPDGIEVF